MRTFLRHKFLNNFFLNNRDFGHFWLTAAFNSFSEQISGLAIPLTAALVLHATPLQMGTMVALQGLPFALFSLPTGVWLDRRAKFPILFRTEFLFPVALFSIPLAYWFGHLSMSLLYAVSFVLGLGYVIGGSASQIFLTHLVGREHLITAQSRFASTTSLAQLVGPGIGGLLIQWLTAPITLLVNGVLFTLSCWNLSFIQRRDTAPEVNHNPPLHDLIDGLKFVTRHPILLPLAWSAALWHILFSGYQALQILFATRELHLTPGVMGAAQTLGGIGILTTSFLIVPLKKRFGSGPLILFGIFGSTLGWILLPLIPSNAFGSHWGSALLYGMVIFIFDCSVMMYFIPYLALRVKLTPDPLLGRMISTMRFITVAAAPLGALAGGWLGEHLTLRPALGVIAVGGGLLTLLALFASPFRSIKE